MDTSATNGAVTMDTSATCKTGVVTIDTRATVVVAQPTCNWGGRYGHQCNSGCYRYQSSQPVTGMVTMDTSATYLVTSATNL